MSNVLPKDVQRAVWRVYRARFITAGSLVALVVAVFAGSALLPMYLALHAGDTPTSAAAKALSAETQKDRIEVGRAQLLIATLAPIATASTTPSQAIAAALSLRPAGVKVDAILYSAGAKKEIVLTGFSSTREGVSAYQSALRTDPRFKTVVIPIGDLAGTKEGKFSATIVGSF